MSATGGRKHHGEETTVKRPASLEEAFGNTAKALQQYGIPRVRVIGLSQGCTDKCSQTADGVRVLTEQQFMREFVFVSRPCIILNCLDEWPAMHRWRDDRYLFDLDHHLPSEEEVSDAGSEGPACEVDGTGLPSSPEDVHRGPKRVTVTLTPNGRADAVSYIVYDKRDLIADDRSDLLGGTSAANTVKLTNHPLANADGMSETNIIMEKVFMCPAEVKATLPELYRLLHNSPVQPPGEPIFMDMRTYKSETEAPPAIAYAQLQNNCLNTEYAHLCADLRPNVQEFGTRVFGESPEAANVWFGIPASVSSMHQDWVENLYAVVRGVKEFVLVPPWEGVFVPKPELPSASVVLDEARCDRQALRFAFKPYPVKDGTVVPWMDLDISPDLVESCGSEGASSALRAAIKEYEAHKARIEPSLTPLLDNAVSCEAEEKRASQRQIHPLVAKVHPGETLYIPALWLHRVSQRADEYDIRARATFQAEKAMLHDSGDSIPTDCEPALPLIAAVNYWFDMNMVNPSVVILQEFGLLL